jgi:sterol 14-demethylase
MKGRHSCIGEKFAFLQIKTIWTTLLTRFNLSLIGKLEDYPVDNTTVLAGPVGPIKVKYERI